MNEPEDETVKPKRDGLRSKIIIIIVAVILNKKICTLYMHFSAGIV